MKLIPGKLYFRNFKKYSFTTHDYLMTKIEGDTILIKESDALMFLKEILIPNSFYDVEEYYLFLHKNGIVYEFQSYVDIYFSERSSK